VPEPHATGSGWGRVLIAVYAVFALSATGRSTVQLLTKAEEAPIPYALSALAALIYIAATIGLARPGTTARRVAWTAITIELTGVVTVGAVSLARPEWFPDATVWSRFGEGYGYLPLVLPLAGLSWLVATRPGAGTAR
jgi:hypothetical protein